MTDENAIIEEITAIEEIAGGQSDTPKTFSQILAEDPETPGLFMVGIGYPTNLTDAAEVWCSGKTYADLQAASIHLKTRLTTEGDAYMTVILLDAIEDALRAYERAVQHYTKGTDTAVEEYVASHSGTLTEPF